MILPDVNLLVHAYNADSPKHDAAKRWWETALNGADDVALTWLVVVGFVRITTHPTPLKRPLPLEEALQVVREWLALPSVKLVDPTAGHFERIATLLNANGRGGNLTTDAHIAAVAMEHGCVVYSGDRDFARFPGLSVIDPLQRPQENSQTTPQSP